VFQQGIFRLRLSDILRSFQTFFDPQPPPKLSRFPASSIQTSCATRSANAIIYPTTTKCRNPVDCRAKLYTHRFFASSYHNPTHKQTLQTPHQTLPSHLPDPSRGRDQYKQQHPSRANTRPNVSVKLPLSPSPSLSPPLLQTTCTSPLGPP
jgi:hypothetical protein